MHPAGALLAMSALDDDPGDSYSMDIDSTGDPDGEADPLNEKRSVQHPPWCWPAWQQRTGVYSTPFSKDNSPWDSDGDADAVIAFATKYWSLDESLRPAFISRSCNDNNNHGRKLWLDWTKAGFQKWKINDAVDTSLTEKGVDPYSVLRRMKLKKVSMSPFRFLPYGFFFHATVPPSSYFFLQPSSSFRTSLQLRFPCVTRS
jgi:hypothetical protein